MHLGWRSLWLWPVLIFSTITMGQAQDFSAFLSAVQENLVAAGSGENCVVDYTRPTAVSLISNGKERLLFGLDKTKLKPQEKVRLDLNTPIERAFVVGAHLSEQPRQKMLVALLVLPTRDSLAAQNYGIEHGYWRHRNLALIALRCRAPEEAAIWRAHFAIWPDESRVELGEDVDGKFYLGLRNPILLKPYLGYPAQIKYLKLDVVSAKGKDVRNDDDSNERSLLFKAYATEKAARQIWQLSTSFRETFDEQKQQLKDWQQDSHYLNKALYRDNKEKTIMSRVKRTYHQFRYDRSMEAQGKLSNKLKDRFLQIDEEKMLLGQE